MINYIKIDNFEAPELDIFARLTGPQLRSKIESESGIFIAESPVVIEVALNSGYEPIALLCDERLINTDVQRVIDRCEGVPTYIATREVLSSLTGFALTRGMLCAMKRKPLPEVAKILESARRIVVFEAIADSTNIGALFRSAAALNMDAILITPDCCDPLCRRAIRVSMGTVFQAPWTQICENQADWRENGIEILHKNGFKTCAMALRHNTIDIDSPILEKEEKLAIILGTEGTGLENNTIEKCDYTVKIPMSHGVDSLNVAACGAIAFYVLGNHNNMGDKHEKS